MGRNGVLCLERYLASPARPSHRLLRNFKIFRLVRSNGLWKGLCSFGFVMNSEMHILEMLWYFEKGVQFC